MLNKDNFKAILKKINLKYLIIVVIVLVILFLGGYYWWSGTPQYSLLQIKKAYNTHDSNLALKYIDSDAIFEKYWNESIMKVTKETSSSNGFEALGAMIGLQMVQNMKPTMKSTFEQSIIESFSENQTDNNSKLAQNLKWAKKVKINYKGSMAIVDLSNDLKFIMTKNNHHWIITGIEGI